MNNMILTARRTATLVRVWRCTGDSRMPLTCVWVQGETDKLLLTSADSSSGEIGGLRLCA